MTCLVYAAADYDRRAFEAVAPDFTFTDKQLNAETAALARGCVAVCCFVNDDLGRPTLEALNEAGVRYVLLRCAGYDRLDVEAAKALGIKVARVPAYCPQAIAEHTLALTLAAARKLGETQTRHRYHAFGLEGLEGFTICGKTVGIIGAGRIGQLAATLFRAFGAAVLFYDPYYTGTDAVELPYLLNKADIITLNAPLTAETYHMINAKALAQCKKGVVIVNTARGGLVDAEAILEDLNHHHRLGHYAADVYEGEAEIFFTDRPKLDDTFRQLLAAPEVTLTGHQAFLTTEALREIAETTVDNLKALRYGTCINQIA